MRILAAKYRWPLMAVALKTGLQWHDAQEVVQDTLLAAYQRARDGTLGSNAGPWLQAVAKNKAIDRGRKNRNVHKHEAEVLERLELESGEETGGSCSGEARKNLFVRRVLAELNEADRECLTGVGDGATIEELAEQSGSNKNAARQRKFRAIERFKAEVKKRAEQGDRTAQDLLALLDDSS